MRCLYCGKELALLKRWTGGGDFCSDAHRQRYQEEYNQLALNRLLQAQQPADAKPLSKSEIKLKPEPVQAATPARAETAKFTAVADCPAVTAAAVAEVEVSTPEEPATVAAPQAPDPIVAKEPVVEEAKAPAP